MNGNKPSQRHQKSPINSQADKCMNSTLDDKSMKLDTR